MSLSGDRPSLLKDLLAGLGRPLSQLELDRFDQQSIFMDVDTIQPGLDFVVVVQTSLM